MATDNPEYKEWAARKIAEVLSLEEKERAVAASPPEELREISDVVDREVMPIMESFGIPITREELSNMFVEWFVKRSSAPKQEPEGAYRSRGGNGQAGPSPPSSGRKGGGIAGPLMRIAKVDTLGGLLGRTIKGVLVLVMLVPIMLLPAYFFLSTLPVGPAAFTSTSGQPGGAALAGVTLTLNPSSPLIGLGQTQNYSLLTIRPPASGTTPPMSLVVFSPEGLSFELSQTHIPSQQATKAVQVVIRASSSMAVGPYSVTVEEKSGSSTLNQTFTVVVVPSLVVMKNLAFVPQTVNVTKGTTVYWMNLDSEIGCCDPGYHNAVFSSLNASSPILVRLATWHFTFETPGEFYYMCSIHPFMAGEVIVKA